jgi:hypothetical protein
MGRTLVAALLLLPANALASPVDDAAPTRTLKRVGTENLYDFVGTPPRPDGIVTARQVLPATATTGLAQSRLVYLNKGPVTITPGDNNAATNRSSLASNPVNLGGWSPAGALWNDTVTCIESLFAPYEIAFTQSDPGNVPHIEAVFGGKPALFGLSNNVGGVSPFTADCSIIESSMVFTFVEIIPANAQTICEIAAQEIAHSFGLDHEVLAPDPMSYFPFEGNRAFQDKVSACGEYEIRPCGLGGTVCRRGQNSVAILNERLGARVDTVAPEVGFLSPPAGATVPPGFRVQLDATDNIIVRSATFYVDGARVGEVTTEPFELAMPADLAEGMRTIRVEVSDGKQSKTEELAVQVRIGAVDPSDPGATDVLGGCSATEANRGGGNRGALTAFLLCAAVGFRVQRRRAHR